MDNTFREEILITRHLDQSIMANSTTKALISNTQNQAWSECVREMANKIRMSASFT